MGKLSAEEMKAMIDSEKNKCIIDLRSEDEYQQGHIAGSINLPLHDIKQIADIVRDLQTPLFICCQSGRHSVIARTVLLYLGYTQVWNIGGMQDWPYETV